MPSNGDEGVRLGMRAKRLRTRAVEAEKAYADWLYEHREDADLWEEVVSDDLTDAQREERRARFTVTVCVRFDPPLTRTMNERQRVTGETYSDLIRAAVAAYIDVPPGGEGE